VAGDDNKLQN